MSSVVAQSLVSGGKKAGLDIYVKRTDIDGGGTCF